MAGKEVREYTNLTDPKGLRSHSFIPLLSSSLPINPYEVLDLLFLLFGFRRDRERVRVASIS